MALAWEARLFQNGRTSVMGDAAASLSPEEVRRLADSTSIAVNRTLPQGFSLRSNPQPAILRGTSLLCKNLPENTRRKYPQFRRSDSMALLSMNFTRVKSRKKSRVGGIMLPANPPHHKLPESRSASAAPQQCDVRRRDERISSVVRSDAT